MNLLVTILILLYFSPQSEFNEANRLQAELPRVYVKDTFSEEQIISKMTDNMYGIRHTILSFGDSWAYGNYYALKNVLQKNGVRNVQVLMHNLHGSEAEYFAKNTSILPNTVTQTKADFVLLSLGGNDLKNIYFRKKYKTPWAATSQIRESLETIVDALYKEHPNVNVVMYGYDFLGNAEDYFLKDKSAVVRKLYHWLFVPFSNYVAGHLGKALASMEKKYQKENRSFTYVPLWGTLQNAIEKEEEIDKEQGFSYWRHSATEFMRDPIHANEKGYNILLSKLYKKYFERKLQ